LESKYCHFEEVLKMKALLVSFLFTLILILVPLSPRAAASSETMRQGLANSPGIKALYAVDGTHTLVMGAMASSDETVNFHVLGRYYAGPDHALQAVMIEHGEEPMIHKNVNPDALKAMRSGSIKLSRGPFAPAGQGYSSLDVLETASLSCVNNGGHVLYVIPKKYGAFKRLTEVPALEAFQYILLQGSKSVWFVACDGKASARFQVFKNYGFINDGEDVARFRQGLVLDDVNYVKEERAEAARLARLQKTRSSAVESLEATAREIAVLKKGFVKNIAGKRYYGSYSDEGKGRCAAVSLRRMDVKEEAVVTVVHDYKVCSGKVTRLGLGEVAQSVPDSNTAFYRRGGLRLANNY